MSAGVLDSDIFDLVPDGVIVASVEGTIVTANPAVLELLGHPRAGLVGQPLVSIIPERFHDRHLEAFQRWADGAALSLASEPVSLVATRSDGTEVPVSIGFRELVRDDERVVVAFVRPMLAPSARSALTIRLLDLMGRGLRLNQLLTGVLRELTEGLAFDVGLVWLDQTGDGVVYLGATWPEVDLGADAYAADAARWQFGSGDNLVGSVLTEQQVVWVPDLQSDPRFDRREVAIEYGLRSAVLFPLLSGSTCVGVVELVGTARRGMDIASHDVVEALSRELGALLVQRFDAERAAAERQRLDLAVEASELGIWTWHLPSGRVEGSAQMAALLGLPERPFVESFDDFLGHVTPEHRGEVRERLETAARDGQRFDHLYEIDCGDKTSGWLRGAGQGLFDADGKLQSITGVAFDVSDSLEYAIAQDRQLRHATLVANVGRILTAGWLDDETLDQCAAAVVETIDAAFARIWTIDDGADELVLRASAGMYTHLDGEHARIPVGSYKIGRIAQSRKPHLTNSVLDDPEISDPDWAEREGMVSFAGYPLLIGGRCSGVLGLFSRSELDTQTLRLIGTVADMIALAQARHAAYAERSRVAEVLQRSLLPPQLPSISGVELSSSYLPSIGDLSGDFYDVFPLRGDDWGIVIGDVRGKGPTAASATALARHTMRTAAMLRRGTDAPLRALNAAMLPPLGDMCTAMFARFVVDGDGVQLTLSRAGHPPPVLRRADGAVESPTGGGPMIGVFPSVFFEERTLTLAPGDALVLYTDGVTEARRNGEFFGEERLARLVADAGDIPAQVLADSILGAAVAFHDAVHIDDIAVLVVKCRPAD